MKRIILVLCSFVIAAHAKANENYPTGLSPYLQLLQDHPDTLGPLGNWEDGEIEILTDLDKISQAEKNVDRNVGIIAHDRYWIWLNDAVQFPNGKYGVYGRMLWTQSLHGKSGVAVMCMLSDGKIALNCNYRHATRAWEIELPRGGLTPGETIEEAARREVLEETGYVVDDLVLLGELAGDSGMVSDTIPVFLARVVSKHEASPEESEAIEAVIGFSVAEILEGLSKGVVEVTIRGKKQMVKVRDPMLSFALLQAHLHGLLSQAVL